MDPDKRTSSVPLDTSVPSPADEKPHATVKLKRERRRRPKEAPRVEEANAAPRDDGASMAHAPTLAASGPSSFRYVETPVAPTPDPASSQDAFRLPIDPKRWDRYELLGLLGRGGMGAVYEARDRKLDRHVAIKFIHGADPVTTMRFLQEARAQARIDHPNVCKVLEVGEVEGKAYIAMQLVRGVSLAQAAQSMTLDEKVRVMKTVTEAVHAAHRLGIIHRDIKPANIMVEKIEGAEGPAALRPVLMDFGLAREASDTKGLTESGAVMGTPGYMPPEQARGHVRGTDPRSDVYSLGATLYDLLAGAPPFVDESAVNVLLKVLIQDAVPLRVKDPSIPQALDIIVGKCLNKEPHQRYATAAELADDLERFLNRERVLARRLSLPTRIYWRAKRNKPMAFAIMALIFSLVAFAGYGARTVIVNARNEAIAQRRAELGQKLGQAVKDLEWLVRSAYLVPLHDTGPEKAVVRARMAEIEAEMRGFGDLGAGLDHYALGRGHLALKEWERAREELQRAEALGVREPELDYALGRVLGELYSQALEDARKSGDKSYFEKRKQEIDKEYLEPALSHLERCRGLSNVPASYLEGLIHFYHGRYDEALKSAQVARGQLSWLYEAEKLEGDVFMARALDGKDRGDNEQAERDFAQAVAHYEKAADIGRSDHQLYEALAEAWIRQEEMDLYRGRDPKPKMERALSAADNALVAAPAESHGHTKKAFAYHFQARYAQHHGAPQAEVEPLFRSQIAAGQRAIALHTADAFAQEATGIAYLKLADYLQDRGQPVEPLLVQARVHLEEAIRLNPRFPWAYNDYGLALALTGISKKRRNEDPRDLFQRAIETTRKAFEIDDGYLIAYNNTALWLTELAGWEVDHGENPEQSLREAVQMADRVLQMNTKHLPAYGNSGLAFAKIALYRLDAGEDGREPAREAIDRFQAMLAIDQKDVQVHFELARAYHLLASHERALGLDPRPSLDEGLHALDLCYGIEPGNARCKSVEAQLRAEQGEWARQQGRPFHPIMEHAQRLSFEATQKLPDRVDLWPVLGEICLQRADALLASGRPEDLAGPVVDEGLRATAQALKLAPGLPRALAIEGALYLHKAQVDPAGEKTALDHAQANLSRAFEGNPLLKRRYAKAAAEVDRLIKGR
ncbi:serine/threonine-protein kinase [Polyangium aurulentum]|uniref:serine/threonine-protein kinase n=1 Tax=Polyangium aurulentum TaxID=2567896 RepID=UPI00146D6508|nr:serine/threonine-protein kinase [Polyangium aurulentum]UQA60636.1 protein kinase [Polyangium aurulentum]